MKPPLPAYRVEPADLQVDRERVKAIWATGLAQGAMQEARLRWYYDSNPEGAPRVFLLRASATEEVVGVATLALRRMRWQGQAAVGGFLVDFVVVPEHRNFFAALLLQKEILRRAGEEHAIIFGTPNARSEAVVRRAGYTRVGHMVRSACILRSGTHLQKVLPGWAAAIAAVPVDLGLGARAMLRGLGGPRFDTAWRERPGEDFDQLWERTRDAPVLIGCRDRAYLEWRFNEGPYGAHRYFTLLERPGGRLVAYAACQVRDNALHVSDFLVDGAVAGVGRRLWLELAREARRRGHRTVSVSFLGPESVRGEMQRAGFAERTRQPMYAALEGRAELADAGRWYLTNADEDG